MPGLSFDCSLLLIPWTLLGGMSVGKDEYAVFLLAIDGLVICRYHLGVKMQYPAASRSCTIFHTLPKWWYTISHVYLYHTKLLNKNIIFKLYLNLHIIYELSPQKKIRPIIPSEIIIMLIMILQQRPYMSFKPHGKRKVTKFYIYVTMSVLYSMWNGKWKANMI
jgi:hypothetical protein